MRTSPRPLTATATLWMPHTESPSVLGQELTGGRLCTQLFLMWQLVQVSLSLHEESLPSILPSQDYRMASGEERLRRAGRVAAPAVLGAWISCGECSSSRPVGKIAHPQRLRMEKDYCCRPLSSGILRGPMPTWSPVQALSCCLKISLVPGLSLFL